ncbi:MAG: endonuclease/exonuclease/phosphatase family protein [Bacteroidota bacterium]
MNFSLQKLAYPLAALLLLLSACGTPYQPEEDPDEEQEEEQEETIEQNDPVPPDGILETVTWNLLGYGTGFTGPSNEDLQTENIVEVVDSLDADLYAFQEVDGQESLNEIIQYMEDYKGFTADHVSQSQKMAFVYNTNDNTIDSVSSGPISDGQNSNAWASRYPMYFEFDYTYEDQTQRFFAVVIHAKAFDDEESYERRKTAAQDLYDYLTEEKPDANIILLGDYNDDVDQSIYEPDGEPAETPYDQFVEDTENFDVITKKLSDAGESASINYEDIIDHITISDELFDEHVENSTLIHDPREYIDDYGETTSDHLPVWAKFDVTAPKR